MLFSQMILISQLCLNYFGKLNTIRWELEITFPKVSLLYLYVKKVKKNLFPTVIYIICASAAERSFTAIISLCVQLCSMRLCSSRKLPSTVPSD